MQAVLSSIKSVTDEQAVPIVICVIKHILRIAHTHVKWYTDYKVTGIPVYVYGKWKLASENI
jgi:hypothetical protein